MRTRLAVVGALVTSVVVLGGCSKSPTGSKTRTPAAGSPSAGTSAAGQSTPGAGSSPSPNGPSQPAAVVIHTGTVVISGAPRTVLTDPEGHTLYYHTADTDTTACTASCADTWPPVLAPSGTTPTATPALPGQLGIRDNDNGRQVEYNGHPLYRYSGDKMPATAGGQGIGKLWFVATPDVKVGP